MSFRRLHPDPGELDAVEAASALRADASPPDDRPYLALNMVATADGRITIGGRSGPIGNDADRELFHELRAQVDAVMVGAGTVRTERYGRMVRDPDRRERRRAAGLDPDPLAVVVSARLALDADIPLLQDPDSRVLVHTASDAELEGHRARVEYLRADAGDEPGTLPLAPLMRELRARGVETVMCEGGAVLNAGLLAERLVDELFLSISPKLAAGAGPAVVAGPSLDPTVEMDLVSVLEAGGHLFLRYRIPAA
ncbi:MAG TPA: dihydrofolate reductase family protein [Thermoleophilaceae bacterium]